MTKTVLITGCSSGLGRSTARHFAEQGWNVVATMRNAEPSLAQEHPGHVIVEPLDVTDAESVERAFAAGLAHFGGIDLVVNNAGITMISILEATPADALRRIFETNVFGLVNVVQAAVPYLRARGGGTIVNISSGVGIAAMPLLSVYSASKQAVEGLSESLSYELESQNIRVRLVEPGMMPTTSFTASGFALSQAASLPESYRAYFDHMLGAMMDYPFPPTDEQSVVDAIYRAATDSSARLRYPVGPDTQEYARLRWSAGEDAYRLAMAELTGHTRWRHEEHHGARCA